MPQPTGFQSPRTSTILHPFPTLVGCGLGISEVDSTNVMAGLQKQGPHQKSRTTIPTGAISEAVSDSPPLEVYEGEQTTAQDTHDPGKFESNPGGTDDRWSWTRRWWRPPHQRT